MHTRQGGALFVYLEQYLKIVDIAFHRNGSVPHSSSPANFRSEFPTISVADG